jgi:hypothetical protein
MRVIELRAELAAALVALLEETHAYAATDEKLMDAAERVDDAVAALVDETRRLRHG